MCVTDGKDLYIGKAVQKAYLEVTEEGAEGAVGSGRLHLLFCITCSLYEWASTVKCTSCSLYTASLCQNITVVFALSSSSLSLRNDRPDQDSGAVPTGHGRSPVPLCH